MDRSTLLAPLVGAMIAAGAAMVLAPNSGLGIALLVIGLVGMILVFRVHLSEEHERRKRRALGYRRSVEALLDMLGEKYGEELGLNSAKGEDALLRLASESLFPTQGVWRALGPIDYTNLRGFLTRTVRNARGQERALLAQYRQTLAESYEEWSRTLGARRRQADEFLPWLEEMRRVHQDVFHLWAYMEWAVTDARESFRARDPNFSPYGALVKKWGKWGQRGVPPSLLF